MTSPFWSSGEHCSASFCLFPQCRSCLLSLSSCRRVRQVCAPEHGGARPVLCAGLDIPCGLHFSTALLMTFVAAQDPAEGWLEYAMSSLPSSVERITRLEITWTVGQALSWAFFSRWFGMDPADNLNLIPPVNPWSGSAWSMYTGLQRTTAIPGVTRCSLDRHSTERWCTAPLTIRTPLARRLWRQARRALRSFSASLERSSSCCQGRSLATRTLEMARSASETLLSSATALTSCFSSIHHAWDSSRGRHSKCRGGSCSSTVVFLVFSNRQRSNCSCLGWGTSGNSRTARDLCARACRELHLAPDPQFTIVFCLSSTVLGCGLSWVLEECQGQIVVMMSCGHPH